MCKVQDVADFFVDSALNDPDDNMTNLRVNKLLFLHRAGVWQGAMGNLFLMMTFLRGT